MKEGGFPVKNKILTKALAAEDFHDLHIVDSHCHMGPWYNYYFSEAGIDSMLQDADKIGVKKLFIAPHAAISCDYRLGNAQAAETAEKHPHRVYGLLVLNPNKPEEIQGEFDTYYFRRNFTGVKLHPTLHRFGLADPGCSRVFDRLREYGGYALCHTWEGNPFCGTAVCESIIRAYPEVAFVLAHSAGTHTGVLNTMRLVNEYENAYMDTSGFEYSDTWIEDIMAVANPSKVLFGSDCPYHDLRGGISRILFSDLDDLVKIRILGENLEAMLKKFPKRV
jgi:uncharacterized protein